MKFKVFIAIAAFVLCGAQYKGFPRGETLIASRELKALIDHRKVTVIAVVTPISYAAGHIPTSLNVWRSDYQQRVDRDAFQALARSLGIDNDSTVVLYDEKYDATRLWWSFFYFGKTDVRVLDGGYAAWKAAGFETEMSLLQPKARRAGNFVAKERSSGLYATIADVKSKNVRIWDVREDREWESGHIPRATYQSWQHYKNDSGTFKTAAEIRKLIDDYKMNPRDKNIFYCHSGVRSATPLFVLYLMGWDPDHLYNYDGSWLEWSGDKRNPIAK